MLKSLLCAKKAFSAVVAASVLICTVPAAPAYAEGTETETGIGITCDVDGKTKVTNIGDDTNGLITISFDKEMDESTLTKDNIVLSKEEADNNYSTVANYEIAVVDSKTVTIDKMYLSNLFMDNSDQRGGTELAEQNFKITVNGVRASGAETAESEKVFSFSTAEIVAPVPYVQGKAIRDVSVGLDVKTRYGFADNTVTAGNGTDRSTGTCVWVNDGNDDASNTEKDDWVAVYDLGSEYEICGAALRNFAGYDDYREIVVGGSRDANLDKSTDQGFEQYFKTNANFGDNSNRNKVFNAFFAQGTKTARYIYLVHPRKNKNTTRFSEIYVFAYVDGPKNFVRATAPDNGATGVTNIGLNESGYVEINFSEEMNTATLNKDSIVLTNGAGTVIDYTPSVNDGTVYKIDKKYLSSLSKTNSGNKVGTALKGDTFTITLNTKAKAASGRTQENYSFSLTTAEMVAPVSYIEGKKIIDVASRLPIEARYGYAESNTEFGGTDGNVGTAVTPKDETSVVANGSASDKWTFRCDLGKEYDIAGIMVQNFNGYNFRMVVLGGSSKADIDKYNDATEYVRTGDFSANTEYKGNSVYSFFDKSENKAARYIYGGHAKTNVTSIYLSEMKVFAYVDASEDPYAFNLVGNNTTKRISAEVNREKYPTGVIVVALYKDGELIDIKFTADKEKTGYIYVAGDNAKKGEWTTFPWSDGHYEAKAYLWNSIEGMQPLSDAETLMRSGD